MRRVFLKPALRTPRLTANASLQFDFTVDALHLFREPPQRSTKRLIMCDSSTPRDIDASTMHIRRHRTVDSGSTDARGLCLLAP